MYDKTLAAYLEIIDELLFLGQPGPEGHARFRETQDHSQRNTEIEPNHHPPKDKIWY